MKDLERKPSTASEIQDYLGKLYSAANQDRDFEYMFSYLIRNVSYLSRSIPLNKECSKNFIQTLSWLFAIANKLEINMGQALFRKYPDVCPYCLASPCICHMTGKTPNTDMAEYQIQDDLVAKYHIVRDANPNPSLQNLVDKLSILYPANAHIWKAAGPTFHFFKLLEELGEVHEAHSSYQKGNKKKLEVENELADCFAWILSGWGVHYPNRDLDKCIIDYYYNSCPVCLSNPCKCAAYSDRGEMLVKYEELRLYKDKISELISVAPNHIELINSVIKNLETAEELGSTTSAVTAVKQSETKLKVWSQKLSSVDSSAKSVKSIINSATGILQSFNWFS